MNGGNMKKSILSVMMVLYFFLMQAAFAGQNGDDKKNTAHSDVITKTFELRHTTPQAINALIKPYVYQVGFERGSSFLVVTLRKENLKAFEDLLAKLDQPRKNIHFRIFTVIASNSELAKQSEMHPDLQGVLTELKKVLGYKTYTLDGVSTLIVSDGSDNNELELNSSIDDLMISLFDVNLTCSGEKKQYTVRSGLMLREKFAGVLVEKDRQVIDRKLMYVESMQLVEGGYIVAGVSKIDTPGPSIRNTLGDALVLVINATVQ